MRSSLARRLGAGVVVSAFALGSIFSMGIANSSAHEGVAHPAHIHTGACPAPGDVVFPLNDVTEATGDMVGSADFTPVDVSTTSVESTLADLVASDHAIVVHESMENIGNYILCGNIGGPMVTDNELAIGLSELNDSGAAGAAVLTDNGDGTTTVSIYVTEKEEAAAPAVSIQDFSFGDPLTVPVGTTVTFTNNDTVPHTVTDKGGTFQSDKIDPGASWTYTFDTAGTFNYFCEFHANMSGTITVE